MAERFKKESVTITSDIKNVAEIEHFIDERAQEYGVDDELYGKLLLSVVEAVTNAIIHGNDRDTSKHVLIEYSADRDHIVYTITDEGPGFNPRLVPDPTEEENLEKMTGRGIFLMRKLADEVCFSPGGQGVTLKFKSHAANR